MLIFDQTAQEQLHQAGRWRTYQPGVRVRIRPIMTADTRRFRQEAQKDGRFNQEVFDLLFWDHLVAEWDGVVGPDRQPLALTAANKLALFTTLQPLGNWAAAESDKLAEEEAKSEGEKLGNSGSSPAGRRTGRATETSPSPAPPAA